MSYILDALKRADAERERGAVPGLHTQQVTTPASPGANGTRNRLWLAAAALALGGIVAGLWLGQKPAGTVRLAALESAVAPPPLPRPAPTPALAPLPLPLPASPPGVAQAGAAASLPPAVSPAVPKVVSRPAPPAPPAPAAARALPPRPRLDPVGKASPAQPAPAAQAASAVSAAIPLLGDLSEDIRRQIPPLAISGAVYSKNPGQRLLLVNNQVLGQGALAAPGVSVEEIREKSSVLSFRGTRFQVAH
jgi:general secretion pathway protein B